MLVGACSSPTPTVTVTPSPTATVFLITYTYPTPVRTVTLPAPATPVPIRLPSPTPFTHTITAGDTLLGIALFYGITVDELLAANPGIDPGFLSIGTGLVIPLGDQAVAAPTPVPLPINLLPPVCYATAAGDLTCFAQVINELDGPMEGVTAQISLVDETGEVLFDQLGAPPLNLIPENSQMPVVVTFAGPLPDPVFSTAALLTAFPVNVGQNRYVKLDGSTPQIEIAKDGRSARLEGVLRLVKGSPAAGQIRAAAIAYDAQEVPVGFRIWEANQVLNPGNDLEYQFSVYSLGSAVARVDLFYEARPVPVEGTPAAP